LSAALDHFLLGGPLTSIMCIAGVQVIISICNYTFDMSPPEPPLQVDKTTKSPALPSLEDEEMNVLIKK
jgi:hypothetical protein